MMNDVAARGFASSGDVYERGRPDYPPEAVAALVEQCAIVAGARVVDLGAGTGKLTRPLLATGAEVIAVEPVADMRAACARALPGVPVVGGNAEALPFADGALDAVVAGTAFHWFANAAALRELYRVLRPGGRLGLTWLARDESVDWIAGLMRLVDTYRQGDPPRFTDDRWRAIFDEPASAALFTPLESQQFAFAHEVDRETALARVASTSFVGALPPEQRTEVLDRSRAYLDAHPSTSAREIIGVPHLADVFWCARR